jgi:long-subunit fatty acid transport protein
MKKLLLILVTLLYGTIAAYGQVTKVGTTVANFLLIETGARAVGMGGAYVAIAEGPSAMYWNPAGIARIDNFSASFNHMKWLVDINYNFIGAVLPFGNAGSLGITALFLSMDDMQITSENYPDGVENGYFSAGSYVFGLSYGFNLTQKFSLGFTAKVIGEYISHSTATAYAFDIGTLYDTELDDLKIGMSISNYGTKMQMAGNDLLIQHDKYPQEGNNPNINANLATEAFDLPLIFRFGLSWDAFKGIGHSNLLLSMDAQVPNNNHRSLSAGLEYLYDNMFSLRGGYNTWYSDYSNNTTDLSGLSLGIGIKYGFNFAMVNFDYAYRDYGVLKDIHMFAVEFTL